MKVEKKKTRERRYTVFRGNRKRTHVERFHGDLFPNSSNETMSLQQDLPSVSVAQNLDEEVAPKATHYDKKKRLRIEEWTKLREFFTNIGISSNSLERNLCDRCNAEDVPLLRCVDCCQWLLLCETCLLAQHNYPHLHIFEGWNCGTFSLVSTETPKWELNHTCNSSYLKSIVIIDDKGRQHSRQICFCSCEPESATLLRYHLWPSSPKRPQLAFDIELLRWIHGLQMECQVSVKGFCEALQARLPKNLKGTVTNQVHFKLIIRLLAKDHLMIQTML